MSGLRGGGGTVPLLRAVCAAGLLTLFGGGCATQAMKGTPFFTGESSERQGPAEDRVNLWPLLYYREPSLSLLWPLGEVSDTHYAIRPLLSAYRREPEAPYTEYNILWPLVQFDLHEHRHRIFPVFWDRDSVVVFPLYWHFDSPYAGPEGTDALFPLWIYRRGPARRDLHLAWPFLRYHDSPREAGWRVWPLAGHRSRKDRLDRSTFWLWPLGGSRADASSSASWLLPVYHYEETADSTAFRSLLWSDSQKPGERRRSVPLALSFHKQSSAGDSTLTLLLGIYRDSKDAEGNRRGHLLPLYAYSPTYAISPLYARAETGSGTVRTIPPLLCWQTHDAETGSSSLYAGAGLFHRRRGDEGRDRDWLLPLYYRDEADGTLMTPLWARQRHADGSSDWSAVPPLLSWRSLNADTGAESLFLGGGLFHRRRGVEGQDRDWLLPLYYRDEADKSFFSPLYASQRRFDGTLDWAVVPPLLSLRRTEADGAEETFALGGLGRWGRDAAGRRHGHLLPLYVYGPDHFLSPFYADWSTGEGSCRSRTQAIPPLLSWRRLHSTTTQSDFFALLGLFHARTGVPDAHKAGHFFPLYHYARSDDTWLTPLLGHWRSQGTRYAYHATPLVGTFSGESRGFWVLPLGGRYTDADTQITHVFWGRHEARRNGSRMTSIFPLYHHERFGDASPLLKALDSGSLPEAWPEHQLGWETNWLLFLGGSKHTLSTWHTQPPPKAAEDGEAPAPPVVHCEERRGNRLFPLWSARMQRTATFEEGHLATDQSLETRSLLGFLYDSRTEKDSVRNHDYVRRRILWRVWHYERLNGDTTMDLFPAVTWDRRADGRRKFSFLWRLFRNETDAAGNRTLDVLFLPVLRP